MRVAILTVSDAGARGERADSSGDAIVSWVEARGYPLAERALVPDEPLEIGGVLSRWADADTADLVLTTGGTGLTARDVTPEATRDVLDKEAPGIAEALRMAVFPRFPRAALSRGVAGVRGRTPGVVERAEHRGGQAGGLERGIGAHRRLQVVHGDQDLRGHRSSAPSALRAPDPRRGRRSLRGRQARRGRRRGCREG